MERGLLLVCDQQSNILAYRLCKYVLLFSLSLSLQSSAVEQVLGILMDILSWEIAEVVSPCLSRGL